MTKKNRYRLSLTDAGGAAAGRGAARAPGGGARGQVQAQGACRRGRVQARAHRLGARRVPLTPACDTPRCRQQEAENRLLVQRVQALERQLTAQDAELAQLRAQVPELEEHIARLTPLIPMVAPNVAELQEPAAGGPGPAGAAGGGLGEGGGGGADAGAGGDGGRDVDGDHEDDEPRDGPAKRGRCASPKTLLAHRRRARSGRRPCTRAPVLRPRCLPLVLPRCRASGTGNHGLLMRARSARGAGRRAGANPRTCASTRFCDLRASTRFCAQRARSTV